MAEEKDSLVLNTEESAELWKRYVREQVWMHLEKVLENAVSGNIGVKYSHPEVRRLETGPEYDTKKADGIQLNLVFKFENVIDIDKDVYKN
jgi:hypothetical protein